MKKYFFYDQSTVDFEFFENEKERDEALLRHINECQIDDCDGTYNMDEISCIKVGMITHKLKFKIIDRKENYEDPEDWVYGSNIETAGDWEIKSLNKE